MITLKGKNIAYKIGSKWFTGISNKNSIKQISEIKKLADVPDIENYVTLLQYLKFNNINQKDSQLFQTDFHKKTKVDRVYVKVEEEKAEVTTSIKDFDKWYWKDYNYICRKCSRDCKQSHVVELVSCRTMEAKK
jgi:hypothetical protein